MTAKKKRNLKDKKQNDQGSALNSIAVDRILAWIFIGAVGLLPLLVRVKLIEFASPKIIHDLVDSGMKADIFSYYKWLFLLIVSITAISLLLFKIVAYRYELRSSYLNIPLLVLASFTLFSGALSDFPGISMIGMYNRHEGSLTYLCYFTLAFVALNTDFKKSIGRNILRAFYVLVSINLIIILFDFYGKDLLNSQIVRSVIVPSYLPHSGMQGHLNSTLSNPNYVSGFSASLVAFFFSAALLEARWVHRAISSLCAVMAFAMLIASLSASGFITLVVVIPLIFILSLPLSRKRVQSIFTGTSVLAACFLVLLTLNAHNPKVWEESIGALSNLSSSIDRQISSSTTLKQLSYLVQPKPVEAAPANSSAPQTEAAHQEKVNDDFNLPKPSVAPLTGRVYIWEKTLDLIKQRPILGYGHDTLTYYFPQNDREKIANLWDYEEIVTKPHNFYLDMAFSSGVPALVALGVLIILHLYRTLKFLIGNAGSKLVSFSAGLFAFTCAFLIQWLVNDSVIGTSVVFWTLLGVSASINHD